ncbi:hypothetical protein LRS05_16450 [Flavobacterium sp. J372]|uniref:hypothetical protein n=1 Tax=Flavobacterium sp. J372 TaxID=2898436 RepID=UPI0021517460|nr:hypothetical protein [Flavobacterium sp. J372]MCR5863595.1 hypothetical protein [Flavobacterium sp. J372]
MHPIVKKNVDGTSVAKAKKHNKTTTLAKMPADDKVDNNAHYDDKGAVNNLVMMSGTKKTA